MNYLLQAAVPDTIEGISLQYGIVGVLALVLGYFAVNQYKMLVKKNEDLEKKVDKLQEEMMSLLTEHNDKLSDVIEANTAALKDLQKLVLEYIIQSNRD